MVDVVIVGAGAAGLMAGIWAARDGAEVLILEGAPKLGTKILVAGGGRCNVTHDIVDVSAYAGSSRHAIKKVLLRFDVPETVDFFAELGVTLKREATGKLFPTTDKARTVLDALVNELTRVGGRIEYPARVEAISCTEQGFRLMGEWGEVAAARVILATGGRSLPQSGSDGQGYGMAQALGHTLTRHVFPALVPLTLPRDHFICELSGITLPMTLTVVSGGKRGMRFTNSTLCTHFGLSGPAPLDISRYYQAALFENPATQLHLNWLPDLNPETLDSTLQNLGKRTPLRWLADYLPERVAQTLCAEAGLDGTTLTRPQRRALVELVCAYPLPLTGNRGFTYAEVTAGGIPLSEIHLERMESRVCPNLFLCGEICDVDGRIGGYNFQWAWASGYVAGRSVVMSNIL